MGMIQVWSTEAHREHLQSLLAGWHWPSRLNTDSSVSFTVRWDCCCALAISCCFRGSCVGPMGEQTRGRCADVCGCERPSRQRFLTAAFGKRPGGWQLGFRWASCVCSGMTFAEVCVSPVKWKSRPRETVKSSEETHSLLLSPRPTPRPPS